MRQARLVASFQREHLPSEESGEESRLIHPGHTSISSSYYWAGWVFFSFFLFFHLLSRSDICWEGARRCGDRAGVLRWGDGWRDPHRSLHAPGTSPRDCR